VYDIVYELLAIIWDGHTAATARCLPLERRALVSGADDMWYQKHVVT